MRVIKYFCILLLLLFSIHSGKAAPKLSNNAQAMLFTCGPGQELYAGFGHSALWINDPANNIDRLYNFGTFDFNTPHFYTRFVRGKLDYMLSVTNVRRFLSEYQHRGIEVYGQKLNLNHTEIETLFALLEENARPENKFYKYDFFMDNCATRIRDVVAASVKGEIDFNTPDANASYRDLLFPYLTHTPWTRMGINLILGLAADKKAPPYNYMYLPEHMKEQFGKARILTPEGERKLVSSERKYLDNKLTFSYNALLDPTVIFTLFVLIVILISYLEIKRNTHFRFVDIILNSISIFAGLFFLFMWLGTDHSATNYNLNSLWLMPAQIVFLLTLFSKKINTQKWITIALSYQIFICIVVNFWPQESEFTFILLNILFVIRLLFHFKRVRLKK